jgi:hypothetical protein
MIGRVGGAAEGNKLLAEDVIFVTGEPIKSMGFKRSSGSGTPRVPTHSGLCPTSDGHASGTLHSGQ